jgi:hypothetical protein
LWTIIGASGTFVDIVADVTSAFVALVAIAFESTLVDGASGIDVAVVGTRVTFVNVNTDIFFIFLITTVAGAFEDVGGVDAVADTVAVVR